MSSPLARGLFQRGIIESCTCSDYISPELKIPSHYFGGDGTSEEIGLRLMRDLNIPDGPDALAKLRATAPKDFVSVLDRDLTVNCEVPSMAGCFPNSPPRRSHKDGWQRCP
jgi:hypothetical protein